MIIHCSAKLSAKLPAKPPKKSEVPAIGKLQHWHAHFLTYQRRQCVLFCEDETRFMLLAKGLKKHHFDYLKDTFETVLFHALSGCFGLSPDQVRKVIKACGDLQADTSTDRSVQGSMRVAAEDLKFYFARESIIDVPHADIQQWLNRRPLTVKGRKDTLWPDKAMKKLVDGLV
ncbi:DUF6933 domain-containing protein [Endozoicomonas montiporae]|uniref:DUF6933 domain-containing protein n=1 Tax=Endozoicomonas montiporae CL-33 TaxID=570277 RepID=A0A142BHY8_9GAMM|nr:hypothetical protein [Endozoicomonas montiporae]AMO58364.1 hypothetical protein EZMO1_4448 [Endozoicomonas montiporae CL-33]